MVIAVSRAIREEAISGRIRKLSVDHNKVIIFFKYHNSRNDKDVGIGSERVDGLMLKGG